MQSLAQYSDAEITQAEYSNTFGTVYAEKFTIHNQENKVINLDNNVRKVKLIKKRNYRKNLLFFFIAMVAAFIFYINRDNRDLQIIAGSAAIITVLAAMLIVEYKFKFMIFRRYDFSEFNTQKHYSDDAQRLALLVNKKIRVNTVKDGF